MMYVIPNLCVLPAVIECDALSSLGVSEVLDAVALACFAVAGAVARPLGSAWLGALLGAGFYLLPGVLLVPLFGGGFGGYFDWFSLRLILSWPGIPIAFPIAAASCSN